MTCRQIHFVAGILLLVICRLAWGRGCVVEGTMIATPHGPVAVEQLRPGDEVIAIVGGSKVSAGVQSCYQRTADEYVTLYAGSQTLSLTPDHPVAADSLGIYISAGDLLQTSRLFSVDHDILQLSPIRTLQHTRKRVNVYNLLVWPGENYFANNILVHNKGCFLPDTPIELATGESKSICNIHPGDQVRAFSHDGQILTTTVRDVLTAHAEFYLQVQTPKRTLNVTAEHPFFVGNGVFKTIDSLHIGDSIMILDGGALHSEAITGIERIARPAAVYNLHTDEPNTFFAHGVAVHNKGGGCFPAGTNIMTPGGPRAIETLRAGDVVVGVNASHERVSTPILAVHQMKDRVITLHTTAGDLHTTSEHPLLLWDGPFAATQTLAPGAALTFMGSSMKSAVIESMTESPAETTVYNLTVGNPHTFIAENFVVHNKGGCFAAGTKVSLWPPQEGRTMEIQLLRPGELLVGYDSTGRAVPTRVQALYRESGTLLEIQTDMQAIHVTPEHPLILPNGRFTSAELLHVGDMILTFNNGQASQTAIRHIITHDAEVPVYNLAAEDPHTFVADGIVVHNKGSFGGGHSSGGFHYYGGGHGGYGSTTRSSDSNALLIPACLFGGVIIWIIIKAGNESEWKLFGRNAADTDQELDVLIPREYYARKVEQTLILAKFLAKKTAEFDPQVMTATASETFKQLQHYWQSRDYSPMQPLMTSELYSQHILQLSQMMEQHEINMIEDLVVESTNLIHIHYGPTDADHNMVVLFTARARDYYIDDRTRKHLRGDLIAGRFQEFWTFRLIDHRWILSDIEQSRESSIHRQPNFVANMTEQNLSELYRQAGAAQDLPLVKRETTRLDIAIAEMAKNGPAYTPTEILARARMLYTAVMSARQAVDPSIIGTKGFDSKLIEDLRQQCSQRQLAKQSVEYRNFTIRKAQIVSVRPCSRTGEYTCLIQFISHAIRIQMQNGQIISQDPYEKTFEEYATMRYQDGQWNLVEVAKKA